MGLASRSAANAWPRRRSGRPIAPCRLLFGRRALSGPARDGRPDRRRPAGRGLGLLADARPAGRGGTGGDRGQPSRRLHPARRLPPSPRRIGPCGIKLLAPRAIHVFHFNDYPADPPREKLTDADRVYPGDGGAARGTLAGPSAGGASMSCCRSSSSTGNTRSQDPLTVARTGIERMEMRLLRASSRNDAGGKASGGPGIGAARVELTISRRFEEQIRGSWRGSSAVRTSGSHFFLITLSFFLGMSHGRFRFLRCRGVLLVLLWSPRCADRLRVAALWTTLCFFLTETGGGSRGRSEARRRRSRRRADGDWGRGRRRGRRRRRSWRWRWARWGADLDDHVIGVAQVVLAGGAVDLERP